MTERIAYLTEAAAESLGCVCQHAETVHVSATEKGLPAWEGEVEVFNLQGHSRAQQAFAWMWPNDTGQRRFTVMAGIAPVTSAQEAVLSALRSQVAPNHE